ARQTVARRRAVAAHVRLATAGKRKRCPREKHKNNNAGCEKAHRASSPPAQGWVAGAPAAPIRPRAVGLFPDWAHYAALHPPPSRKFSPAGGARAPGGGQAWGDVDFRV